MFYLTGHKNMQTKITMSWDSLIKLTKIEKPDIQSVGKAVDQRELRIPARGVEIGTTTLENDLVLPNKTK